LIKHGKFIEHRGPADLNFYSRKPAIVIIHLLTSTITFVHTGLVGNTVMASDRDPISLQGMVAHQHCQQIVPEADASDNIHILL
jgi:hypothetical protein